MHKQTGKHEKRLIALILVMILVFTATMPINAMEEQQNTEEDAEVQQAVETADATDAEMQTELRSTEEVNWEPVVAEAGAEKPSPTETETTETTSAEAEETVTEETITTESKIEENETEEPEIVETAMEATGTEELQEVENETSEQLDGGNMAVMAADTSDLVTAPDLVGTINKANEWQIVSEEYTGREQENKKSYDIDKDGSDDIFYQKNVIPTEVENEFLVYMGITKKMTWDELLAESDFSITTANNWHKVDIGTRTNSINGNYSTIYPGKTGGNNYSAVVKYLRGGQVIHTYQGWYHGTTPNCSQGTGFIYLKSLKTYLVASHSVDLGNGGNQLTFTVDLDAMAKQNVQFSVDDIVVDSVQDTMGNYIKYEGVQNCDGAADISGNTLTWNPASNGVDGVEVTENGGLTGYHYNIHQLVYRTYLDVMQQGFQSCAQNMNSKVGDSESYRVNQQAVLNCHMGTYTGNSEFQIPYVRGLLYDLEFQKVIKGSKISLSDISFQVTRQQSGSTMAEQLSQTVVEKTDSDGWIKFHNLPWGNYVLQELVGAEDSFQDDYLDGTEQKTSYTIQIGKVINASALTQDHGSGHSVDWQSDVKNMLVKYNGTGIFENTVNTAKITIRKIVKEYDGISEELKNQSYNLKTENTGTKEIYLKQKPEDTSLHQLKKQESKLKHGESVTYECMVPKEGGVLSLEEIIPEAIENKMVFDSVTVEKNANSTEPGIVTNKERGCEIHVLPGNDLTITITNIPVGKVKIQKVIDNYQNALSDDAFIIRAESADDNGQAVNVETVLKHQELSETITIKKTTILNIDEILPKEYAMSQITLSGGGTLNSNQVIVQPGEDIVVIVHNTYIGKPFFHVADAIKNIFQWK